MMMKFKVGFHAIGWVVIFLMLTIPCRVVAQTLPSEALTAVFRIQVVAIEDQKAIRFAEEYAQKYSKRFNIRAYVIHKDSWYKVLLGDFPQKKPANAALRKVKTVVKDAWLVAPDNDKIVSVWEDGNQFAFAKSKPTPIPPTPQPTVTMTPEIPKEPTPGPPTPQPTVTMTPEMLEEPVPVPEKQIAPTPPPKSIEPQRIIEKNLVAVFEEHVAVTVTPKIREKSEPSEKAEPSPEKRSTPTPLPGVIEEDLTSSPQKQTLPITVPELSEDNDTQISEEQTITAPEVKEEDMLVPPAEKLSIPTLELPQKILSPLPDSQPITESRSAQPEKRSPSASSKQSIVLEINDLRLGAIAGASDREAERQITILSPNSKFLLTTSQEKILELWDLESEVKLRAFVGHKYQIVGMSFSPDGQHILSAARFEPDLQGEIRLWESETGRELLSLRKDVPGVEQVGFSTDGKYLYHRAAGERIWWDLTTGEEIPEKEIQSEMVYESVQIHRLPSPEMPYILKGQTIWDVEKNQEVLSLLNQQASASVVEISPNGNLLALGFDDGVLEVWDVLQGERRIRKQAHSLNISDLLFAQNGQVLYSTSFDRTIKMWSLEDMTEHDTFSVNVKNLQDIRFCHKTNQVSVLSENEIEVVDLSTQEHQHISNTDNPGTEIKMQQGELDSIVCSQDAAYLLAFDYDCCHPAALWNLTKNEEIPLPEQFETPVSAAELSPGGNFLALGRGQVVDFFKGKPKVEIYTRAVSETQADEVSIQYGASCQAGLYHSVTHVSFSPDGKYLVVGQANGELYLFQPFETSEKGETILIEKIHDVLRTFEGHAGAIHDVAFFPDGKRMVSISADGSTRIWNVESGKELVRLISGDVETWAMITPDHYFIASNKGIETLHFAEGLHVFPYQQAEAEFHRPDIVLERLGQTSM